MSEAIQATVAVYPLQQEGWEAVDRAVAALRRPGVEVEVRAMQTEVIGETGAVFAALKAAFEAAAAQGMTVMAVTLSNACPVRE
ncbi:MAG: hypothetical protein DYG91_07590 [Chloroflexi bacterium CFX7]|nr:MAG: hypothetical protein EDM76_04650 [bacterium]MCE7928340.1 hypothetical protein [Chloroflexi bacterium CFX7]MCK6563231.1 thiamine-binding protein [Dehalococcoidia bacterium]MCL4232813.1 thiamine-binding protein [Dehalococcoidia bacterium]RIL02401.1 MAG: hypothetical protein DCC78_06950 [bacterium]